MQPETAGPGVAPRVAGRELVRVRDASGGRPLAERLRISRGVERPAGDARYEPGAFVARGPWEPLPRETLARLAAPPGAWDERRMIGVVRVPEDAMAGLTRVGVACAPDRNSYRAALAHADFPAALEEASLALGEYLVSAGGLTILGTAANLPGMRTVTRDSGGGERLVGLHLDVWDDIVPTGFRTNRICVNLGRTERAFLYVPFAADSLGLKAGASTSERVERFFQAHPSCPVVRITLAPGEAYIAPTEMVLHDGTTELSASLDVTLTLRGQFGLAAMGHGA